MEQQISAFDLALIDQRNQAMNEAAAWRARASELEQQLKDANEKIAQFNSDSAIK